jgi:hypothetical protein
MTVRIRKKKPHRGYLQKDMQKACVTVWERWQYRFDFENGVYLMGGKKLRLTPAEELHLYERLVLRKRPKETTCRYALQRLRERYGADFLGEAIGHRPSGDTEGVAGKEGWEQILQDYMEKDGRMVYENWGYHFDFLLGSYTWNGGELRVTPKEAVYLYERTILRLGKKRGEKRYAEGSTLCYMRDKFGAGFLRELFPIKRRSVLRQYLGNGPRN